MTATDCVEMGIEAAARRALEVAWDGTYAVCG
jgi:agmatinase